MIGVGRRTNIRLMTGNTGARGVGVTGSMAGYARRAAVSTGKWEVSIAVIEGTWFPCRCRVASRAIVVKIILLVIRIGGRIKVSLVAVETQARSIGVSACVAGNTRQRCVSAS